MADKAEVSADVLNFDNLVNIFWYLSPKDLNIASKVCRLWNEAANTSSLWRKHCMSRWIFCNITSSPGKRTWKRYYLARYQVDTGAVTGRPGLDYVCKSLRGHKGLVTDILFITNNDIYDGQGLIDRSAQPIIASCSQDKTVGIWNTREGKNLWKKTGHEGVVSCLALIKHNELFISGDQLGVANLWDVTTGQQTKLNKDNNSISKICCSSCNEVYIASRSGGVKLWDIRDITKPKQAIQTPLLGINLMSVKDNIVVLAGSDSIFNTTPGVKVYDIRNPRPDGVQHRQEFQHPNGSLDHPTSSVKCFQWLPYQPGQLAAGYNDGSIHIWDVKTFNNLYSFRPHVGSVTALATVGSKVISSGTECSLSVWDIRDKKSLGAFVDHNLQITDIYADSYKVMSCSRDFSIRVYSWLENTDSNHALDSRYTLLGGSLQRAGNGFEKIICDYTTCVGMANDVMKAYSFQV